VNNENHEKWVDKLKFRKRLYITINENDKALLASRMKLGEEQKPRLGHLVKNLVAKNPWYIDFSDAAYIDESSHAYFEAGPIKNNKKVKDVFSKMFNGKKVEQELNWNPINNSYKVI